MNDLVVQVQFLTRSDRNTRDSMDQGGWIDNHLNEVRQRTESLNILIKGMEVRSTKMEDAIRDLGVEVQPRHVEQKMKHLIEKHMENLGH